MEVRESHALAVEPVQVGRAKNAVSVAGQVSIPLVICDHQHYVRGLAFGLSARGGRSEYRSAKKTSSAEAVRPGGVG